MRYIKKFNEEISNIDELYRKISNFDIPDSFRMENQLFSNREKDVIFKYFPENTNNRMYSEYRSGFNKPYFLWIKNPLNKKARIPYKIRPDLVGVLYKQKDDYYLISIKSGVSDEKSIWFKLDQLEDLQEFLESLKMILEKDFSTIRLFNYVASHKPNSISRS